MEDNENTSNLFSRIRELKGNLGDIGKIISSIDMVTVTLNDMLDEYQMFVTGLEAREKAPTFDELTCILLQEEECRKNLNRRSHSLYLALVAKGKQPYKENPWRRNKEGKPHTKPSQRKAPCNTLGRAPVVL